MTQSVTKFQISYETCDYETTPNETMQTIFEFDPCEDSLERLRGNLYKQLTNRISALEIIRNEL